MLVTSLIGAAQRAHPLRIPLLVVAVSVAVALLFTFATRPAAEVPRVAGEARISLMQDEHALVAAYVRADVEAKAAAAQRDRAEMQAEIRVEERSVAETQAAQLHVAAVKAPAARPHIAAVAPAKHIPAAGPPLPLQANVAAPQPAPSRPIVRHTRAVLATVAHIPGWVRDGVETAADWAIISPVKTMARWPERRFL
jgi:hypothetical protein